MYYTNVPPVFIAFKISIHYQVEIRKLMWKWISFKATSVLLYFQRWEYSVDNLCHILFNFLKGMT